MIDSQDRSLLQEDSAAHQVAERLGFDLVRRFRSIDIYDEAAIKAGGFLISKPKPDYARIAKALDAGEEVAGARWKNGTEYCTEEGRVTKRKIPPALLGDPGWRAALHILTSPLFEESGAVWSRVDLKSRSIDFADMLDGPWSGGERRMLRLAASLFNPKFSVALWEDLGSLDHDNAQVVLDAMALFMSDGK